MVGSPPGLPGGGITGILPVSSVGARISGSMPAGQADEERVLQRLSQNDVVGALADVPHDFRDVIVLVDIGDFSYQDAANILDIPIGTVMSRLARARALLKEKWLRDVEGARDGM